MLMNVFNMGFGESILLQKDRESLLVDCGSKRKDNAESQIEWIWSGMNDSKSISFMLTHFHEDHFNRFEALVHHSGRKADVLYLPWINFYKNRVVLCDLAIYLYLLCTRPNTDVSFLLRNQFKFICRCVKVDGLVYALRQGDFFQNSNTEMEVLWPKEVWPKDIGLNEVLEFNYKKVEKIIQKILDTFFTVDKDRDKFNRYKENLKKELINFHKLFQVEGKNLFIKIDEGIQKELKRIVDNQDSELKKIDEIRERNLKGKETDVKRWRDKLREIFNDDINACSIVFRDKQLDDTHYYNLLMTGDITKRVVDKYLYRDYFKNNLYEYMKCPHHGTSTHYTVRLPQSCNLIISNGRCGNYQDISENYFNHSCLHGRRYCTNNHCEVCKNGNPCMLHHCGTERFFSLRIPDL